MPANPKPQLTDRQDAKLAEYQALSGLAVAGLIFGLLSPLWMIDPLLWLLPAPPLGILFSTLALWQIARHAPTLVGRKAALAGLILSILFGTAAPANSLAYRWAVRREALQFAHQWFEFLRLDQPHKAFQLTRHPKSRQPLDDGSLRDFYRPGSPARDELDNYLALPLIRTLRALRHNAQVRYFQTDGQGHLGEKDTVIQTFAVTYPDRQDGAKKTFFIRLNMERFRLDTGEAEWQLGRVEDGFKPEGL